MMSTAQFEPLQRTDESLVGRLDVLLLNGAEALLSLPHPDQGGAVLGVRPELCGSAVRCKAGWDQLTVAGLYHVEREILQVDQPLALQSELVHRNVVEEEDLGPHSCSSVYS